MPAVNTGFQQIVNNELPVAVAGDFASANPRASTIAGRGEFVAGQNGVSTGTFAWFNPTTGLATQEYQLGSILGFVHRENNALITTFLGVAASKVVAGNQITGMSHGEFWGVLLGGGSVGQTIYCDPVFGTLTAAAAGSAVASTSTATSVSNTGLITVGGTLAGSAIAVGQVVTGNGLPEGSYISALGTGSGGAGTYQLTNLNGTAFATTGAGAVAFQGVLATNFILAQNVDAGFSCTGSIAAPVSPATQSIFTVASALTGTVLVGDYITSAGVPANTYIVSQLTGTAGGVGTYLLNNASPVVGSSTITGVGGQLAKISSSAYI